MSGQAHLDRRLFYFQLLSREEQCLAIAKLARQGFSDHGISAATTLSVEQIRKILGEQRAKFLQNSTPT